jgi:hypothetical protein
MPSARYAIIVPDERRRAAAGNDLRHSLRLISRHDFRILQPAGAP